MCKNKAKFYLTKKTSSEDKSHFVTNQLMNVLDARYNSGNPRQNSIPLGEKVVNRRIVEVGLGFTRNFQDRIKLKFVYITPASNVQVIPLSKKSNRTNNI